MSHAHHTLDGLACERSRRSPTSRGRGHSLLDDLSGPVTEPVTEPVTFGDRPAPGSPCKCTPNSPAAFATTRPPRLRRYFGWSQRPWGWLSISRGNPGPALAVQISSSDECWRERKNNNNNSQDEARNRGLRLGGCARRAQVIAFAIGARFACCGRDNADSKARAQRGGGVLGTRGCARGRTLIAAAIAARLERARPANAAATQRRRRR